MKVYEASEVRMTINGVQVMPATEAEVTGPLHMEHTIELQMVGGQDSFLRWSYAVWWTGIGDWCRRIREGKRWPWLP